MPDTDTNQTLLETHCLWKKGQYQEWGGWQREVREEAWGQQVVPSCRGHNPSEPLWFLSVQCGPCTLGWLVLLIYWSEKSGGWRMGACQEPYSVKLWSGALTRLQWCHCHSQGVLDCLVILKGASHVVQQTDFSSYGILTHPVQACGA